MGWNGKATVVFGEMRLARLRAYCETNELEFSSAVQFAVDALMNTGPAYALPWQGATAAGPALTLPRQGVDPANALPDVAQPASPLALSPPTLSLDLDPLLPFSTQTPPLSSGGNHTSERAELDWRVTDTWAAHLRTREKFWRQRNGQVQPAPEAPRPEVRKAIVEALREFDADRLGPTDRERWRRESPVRAAGQGIFVDPWCTAKHKDNDIDSGGRTYLEDFRPWKAQRGKGSPVPRFAALAFEARSHAPR